MRLRKRHAKQEDRKEEIKLGKERENLDRKVGEWRYEKRGSKNGKEMR